MIRRARAFVQSLLRNPAFRRAAGFEGSWSILGISPGAIRLGFFALYPFVVAIALMLRMQFSSASPSIVFLGLFKFVLPTLLAVGFVEGALTFHARIERASTGRESGPGESDSMPLVLGLTLPYIAGACALLTCLAITFLPAYPNGLGRSLATKLALSMYASAHFVPIMIDVPVWVARRRLGLKALGSSPSGDSDTQSTDHFCAIVTTWTIYECVVVGSAVRRPSTADTAAILFLFCLITFFQCRRIRRLLFQFTSSPGTQNPVGGPAIGSGSVGSAVRHTFRGVLLRLRENPVFLRSAGFMYIRHIGRWPEGALRIAVILGFVPLAVFATQIAVGWSRAGFSTVVALTILLIAPLLGLAATLDTLRTARTIDGKRVDGPLALTRLTFSDIAIGRCVGNAVFPILTGITLLMVGVVFLISWLVLYSTGSASRFTAVAILTVIAWSAMIPEMSIRLLRQVVTGNATPWRSALFLLSIPFQYAAFTQLAVFADMPFLPIGWSARGVPFPVYRGSGNGFPYRIMAPLLLLFAAWRWRICWLLILSAGAAMEANMRAWWESGEHD